MNLSLINPYIRHAAPSIIPANHHIPRRIIYDYELVYIERGNFTFLYDNVAYPCAQGDIIFIRPNVEHSFIINNEEISQPHIHFDITERLNSDKIPISFKPLDAMNETEISWIHEDYFLSYNKNPLMKINDKTEFLNVFYRAIAYDTPPLIKKALLIQLLSMLINDNFPYVLEKQSVPCIARKVKDYVDAGNGFNMSLEDFSKYFCYDKFYLEKKFKDLFQVGIISYRNRKRMEYARRLLNEYSVTEVAEKLGFGSIYSFSRAYKNYFGCSPMQSVK